MSYQSAACSPAPSLEAADGQRKIMRRTIMASSNHRQDNNPLKRRPTAMLDVMPNRHRPSHREIICCRFRQSLFLAFEASCRIALATSFDAVITMTWLGLTARDTPRVFNNRLAHHITYNAIPRSASRTSHLREHPAIADVGLKRPRSSKYRFP